MDDKTGERIVRRYDSMKGDLDTFETLWQETAEYVLPHKSSITREYHKGQKKTEELFSSDAKRANEKLAAGLFGFMTPPNEEWFQTGSAFEHIQAIEEVAWYFGTVSSIIRKALYDSNFPLEINEDFLELGAFGTSNLYMEAGKKTALRFTNIRIGTYAVAENAEGEVDTVYRQFEMTVRQLAQKFGLKNLSEDLQQEWNNEADKGKDKKYKVIHAVEPRSDYKPQKRDKKNKPFASYYVERKGKHLISEGGYDQQPYIVSRFAKGTDEAFGRGPGTETLPEIKMLNLMRKTTIRAAEKKVDPPILLPDDGVLGRFKMTPGAINYMRKNRWENQPTPFETKGDVGLGLEMIQAEAANIKEAFHNDLFDVLSNRRNMTATEVVERIEEKLVLFSPIFARVSSEKLTRIIERAFHILNENGYLPPPPQVLLQYPEYKITYISKIALALKSIDINAVSDTLATVGPYMNFDPTILDNFNFNNITRGTAQRNNVPVDFMNSQEQIAAIREQRAEREAQEHAMEMANKAADVASKTSKPVEPGSPLEALAS